MPEKIIKIFIIIVFVMLNFAFPQNNEFAAYLKSLEKKFDVEQVTIDSLNLKNVILLDARELEEYKISHIRSAVHIGYDNFEVEKVDSLPKDADIVVYCSVGYRSSEIAEKLRDMGYEKVKNLHGGIFEWANSGRELVNNTSQTRQIHSYDKYWGRFITNPNLIKVTE